MQLVYVDIIRDDGQEFIIDNVNWLIPNDGLENWANLPHQVSVQQTAQYDGGMVTNQRIETVDRSIKAELANVSDNATRRKEAIAFFAPKHTYKVYLTYQERTLWCEGVQAGFVCANGNIYQPISFEWTILCPSPFLLSVDNFGKDVAGISPKFGFPLHCVVKSTVPNVYARGFITGVYNFSRVVDIFNDGDVDTYPVVTIKAKGDVEDPLVKIGDKLVRVVTNMHAGDVIVIDFEHRPPKVTLNGVNAINKVSLDSSFTEFKIKTGYNTFTYDAWTGENNMSVELRFWKRYVGI